MVEAWWPAQLDLIGSGSSVYWRKYGEAPEHLHEAFAVAEDEAKKHQAGAWATAHDWMRDKAIERTSPKP